MSAINIALIGIGFLLVIEGLVLALAPNFYEDLLKAVRDMRPDQRRMIGLSAVALGVGFLWVAI